MPNAPARVPARSGRVRCGVALTTSNWFRQPRIRRAVTVPAVGLTAAVLGASAGLLAPVAAALDLVRGDRDLSRLRTLSVAWGWSSLESIGVGASAALWLAGRGDDQDLHYGLQRWWARQLVNLLELTAGLDLRVTGLDQLHPGPVIVCARHASIADALIPAWLLGQVGMRPRYVLMAELLADPCLDIVGSRLPNHFVDRDPTDNAPELQAIRDLATGLTADDGVVIFPEGAVASERGRERAVASIASRDPARAERVGQLRHLLPVRPSGTAALRRGAPDADFVFVNHSGFEALARLSEVPGRLPLRHPVHVSLTRRPASEIPDDEGFPAWFDAQWAALDAELDGAGRD